MVHVGKNEMGAILGSVVAFVESSGDSFLDNGYDIQSPLGLGIHWRVVCQAARTTSS